MKVCKWVCIVLLLLGATWVSVDFIANSDIPVLESKGMIGKQERDILIDATLLMLIVVVPVLLMTLFFAWRYRASNTKAKYTPDWDHNTTAELLWWGIPCIIIAVLGVIIWDSSHDLNPFKSIEHEKEELVIQAVALDWKWLFIYPEEGIATVNYIKFPAGRPVSFQITSDAPMNSLWIPALGGQIYAMSGMRAKLHLVADEEGVYRGLSSNISGTGFAGMTFAAHATSQKEFDRWVGESQGVPLVLNQFTYAQLAKQSENHPKVTYTVKEPNFFGHIMMKYMSPKSVK